MAHVSGHTHEPFDHVRGRQLYELALDLLKHAKCEATFVPYIAGYARKWHGPKKDQLTVYYDQRMPADFEDEGGAIVALNISIGLHECAEKWALDMLGCNYEEAHREYANVAEHYYVSVVRGADWAAYCGFVDELAKKCRILPSGAHTPVDLDTRPYVEESELYLLRP